MKLALVVGTRPEIIKMAPVIRACQARGLDFFVLHTGQHYDYALDEKIFEDLGLAQPKYNLHVGGKPYGIQMSLMIGRIKSILTEEKTQTVLVEGDTNSVLAAALAANSAGIKIAHIEAGLRSHDLTMPEEINRVLVDNISDFLFAPTAESAKNLKTEGFVQGVHVTGNTITDAVLQNKTIADEKSKILENLGLKGSDYFLLTAHRSENVDVLHKLKNLILGVERLKEFKIPVLFPIHPRTKNNLVKFNLELPSHVMPIEPQGYLDFLQLETQAKLIITDSGGIQEEASILRVPCVTIRENTERPETLKAGTNVLAGTDPAAIFDCTKMMLEKKIQWAELYGDGNAATKIIEILSAAGTP